MCQASVAKGFFSTAGVSSLLLLVTQAGGGCDRPPVLDNFTLLAGMAPYSLSNGFLTGAVGGIESNGVSALHLWRRSAKMHC